MKIKLVLNSGKEVEFTEQELRELKAFLSEKESVYVPYPTYPNIPTWESPVVTCEITDGSEWSTFDMSKFQTSDNIAVYRSA
jgi:hypothetical protein